MKVALVHSFYRSEFPSGENASVLEQARLLTQAGIETTVFCRSTDEQKLRGLYSLRSSIRIVTGLGNSFHKEIVEFDPDVVHVHNLFPNLGTRWLRHLRVPFVKTLHNYRSVCANGLLLRDAKTCVKCPTGSTIHSVMHGCYHDSSLATIPLALGPHGYTPRNSELFFAAQLICLSDDARDRFINFGFPASKLITIPNGIQVPSVMQSMTRPGKWLFAGRITPEKGLAELLDIWPDGFQLDVAGDGPMRAHLEAAMNGNWNTRFLGEIPQAELRQQIANYDGIIVPSLCLEMQPTIVMEALNAGTPVVAFVDNSVANLVLDRACGYSYNDADSLAKALNAVLDSGERLRNRCREVFEAEFTSEQWLTKILKLYGTVGQGSHKDIEI